MNTYISLLRGINVSGQKIIKMVELTALYESLNFKDVKTYIQSGNVVLKSKQLTADDIAQTISGNFGFKPEVFVIEKSDFLSSIKQNPFHPAEAKSVHFYFCSAKPELNTEKLNECLGATEEYKLIDKVFYLHAPEGIGRSKLVANLESCLGVPVTGRNLNNISKLEEMVKNA